MTPSPRLKKNLFLLASLFLLELSIIIMPMAIYMKGERPFAIFATSRPGVVFFMACAVMLVAGVVIIHDYLADGRSPTRDFRLIVTMNLVTMVILLVTGEIIIRANSGSSIEGETFLSRMLLPKNWEKVRRRYRDLVDNRPGTIPYVNDDVLGWTIAPNKQDADGMFWSSSEGIRASHANVTFASLAGRTRIALVGDSYTLCKEVPYEDTWGHRLENGLGPGFQVLNFGVGGYGVDQAYLRYEKDIRRFKPKIVIYGFSGGAVRRTMWVYPFLSFPNWNFPFSKPRFVLRDGVLKKLNVPALAANTIFSKGSISELPFLEYDPGYKQSDWQKDLYHFSYLARLFVSHFPPWSAVNSDVSDEALVSVNTSILKAFDLSVRQSGGIPIVVYFPDSEELARQSWSLPSNIGKQVLHEAGIPYTDITACLLDPAERLVPSGGHYSSLGHAAIANCLSTVVKEALTIRKSLKRRFQTPRS